MEYAVLFKQFLIQDSLFSNGVNPAYWPETRNLYFATHTYLTTHEI